MSALCDEFSKGMKPAEFAGKYMNHIGRLAAACDMQVVGAVIEAFIAARDEGRTIYFVGNGGSASTASHFANDIAVGASRVKGVPGFKAISLADNMAVITAVANDDSYEAIFASQLEPLVREGDVLVALSVSGNSPNVLRAVETAKAKGALVIGCTGFGGGKLREMADIKYHIPCDRGEYGPVEDMFSILDHCITAYVLLTENGCL